MSAFSCSATPLRVHRDKNNAHTPAVAQVLPKIQQYPDANFKINRAALLKSGLIACGTLLGEHFIPVSAGLAAALPTTAPAIAQASMNNQDLRTLSQVMLTTLSDCQLAVSIYPTFSYNAAGGGGMGQAFRESDGLVRVAWTADSLDIPPITYATSSVLGIPIPPPLKISITPKKLEGTIDLVSGIANLEFLAGFEFTAGPLYTAPPLVVSTTLTTEESMGELRRGMGRRLNAEGKGVLVGVARVPRTGDSFLDSFLMLPTDALAVLSAEMKFVS